MSYFVPSKNRVIRFLQNRYHKWICGEIGRVIHSAPKVGLHHLSDPSYTACHTITYKNEPIETISFMWFRNGLPHRDNGPAMITVSWEPDKYYEETWSYYGKDCREEGRPFHTIMYNGEVDVSEGECDENS